ncbi:glypican-5 isoform X1 [Chiroxiphia lanceolata]|uniref:glypican-5 isoform X1 n=1 Tax=Chiroxiphia lanceolata TaxID=296741 RepID=UPI0013CEEB3E|nr:glypican-5 isoform X1 [Chiroxiphia lanceolata]
MFVGVFFKLRLAEPDILLRRSGIKYCVFKGFVRKTFEMLIRLAENYTSTLFCTAYRDMAAEASVRVQEFFTDVGLFVFGTDISTEKFVNRFFDTLFPVVYNHVINPGLTDISLEYAECLQMARRDIRPFGNIPKKAVGQMGRSLLSSRTFLQALNLGIEVINTTDHLRFSKDCSRALLRMQYCPHYQGVMLSKPCLGYCLNIIRGCLASIAEIDLHWRGYVRSLEELSSAMSGTHDIEHVLLNFHSLVNDALVQAHIHGPELSEQVKKICGPPVRKPTQSPGCSFDQNKDNQGLKMFSRDSEEMLTNRRKEFISHLQLYRAFYGGLADQMCSNELAAADGLPCWNGEDVVKSHICVPSMKVRHMWHKPMGEENIRWVYSVWRFLLAVESQTQDQKHNQTNKFCKLGNKEVVFEQKSLLICPTDCAMTFVIG